MVCTLSTVLLSVFLNIHFHFISDEVFWEMRRRMLMRPDCMECMSFLCKNRLSSQIVWLKWYFKKKGKNHSWLHLDRTLWISLWKQWVKYFSSFSPRRAVSLSSFSQVFQKIPRLLKPTFNHLGGQSNPQLAHVWEAKECVGQSTLAGKRSQCPE